MSTINELNLVVVLYGNDGKSKMSRVTCNALMPNSVGIVKNYWVNESQTFYTDMGIEQGTYSKKASITSIN